MVVEEVESIVLRAREELYRYLRGHDLSKQLGEGYDFAELRMYQLGDDVRHISWINTAKLGEPFVKRMHEERELNVAICSLMDGRFLVGNKRKLLMQVVATLGYAAYAGNDRLMLLHNLGEVSHVTLPTNALEVIDEELHTLANAPLLGKALDYTQVPSWLISAIASKSLLFVVGDFLDWMDLSMLSAYHEVVLIMIRDPMEEHPHALTDTALVDPRTNQLLSQRLTPKAIAHYRRLYQEHDRALESSCYRYGIRWKKIEHQAEILPAILDLMWG